MPLGIKKKNHHNNKRVSAVGHATFVVCKEEIKGISYFLLHLFCTESIVDQIVSFVAGEKSRDNSSVVV